MAKLTIAKSEPGETFRPIAANDNHPTTAVSAQALLSMDFEPVRYVVPGYVAEGLTLFGGRPKLGKSWLGLGFCIAVATGGTALGVDCGKGDVLYLALEDNRRRLKARLITLLPKLTTLRPDLSRLTLDTEAPRIDAGLIERLDTWRTSSERPRMVVIDTLALVRPPKKRTQDSYEADYAALSPLQKWAGEHRIAVVVVTHVRKAEASDPLEMISGTNGLTGAADSILVLDRGTDGNKLYGRGRDIEEIEKALKFEVGHWTVLGDAEEIAISDSRRRIRATLADSICALSPKQIAEEAGLKSGNVRFLLGKMVKAGEVLKDGRSLYLIPVGYPTNSANNANNHDQ